MVCVFEPTLSELVPAKQLFLFADVPVNQNLPNKICVKVHISSCSLQISDSIHSRIAMLLHVFYRHLIDKYFLLISKNYKSIYNIEIHHEFIKKNSMISDNLNQWYKKRTVYYLQDIFVCFLSCLAFLA